MAKGDHAHDKQFLLLPQCFQLFYIMMVSIMIIFHNFVKNVHICLMREGLKQKIHEKYSNNDLMFVFDITETEKVNTTN